MEFCISGIIDVMELKGFFLFEILFEKLKYFKQILNTNENFNNEII